MKKKWHVNFSDWRTVDVEWAFELKRVDVLPTLHAWIDGPLLDCPQGLEGVFEQLRLRLRRMEYSWNEYETMAGFIAPLLSLVSFPGAYHNLFHQRSLTLRDNGHKAEGSVDGLVAFGIDKPEVPFFFLHEYKRSQGTEADPLGQLLIVMVAAQRLNADGQPLYGCYVIGKFWHFVLLEGQTYSVSQGYDATDAGELRIIWSVLMHTKQLIEERVRQILERETWV
jgi:hypothetical protein